MQGTHWKGFAESIMLCPTYQTSWVMENLHDKSGNLPDPDIFTVDIAPVCCLNSPPPTPPLARLLEDFPGQVCSAKVPY